MKHFLTAAIFLLSFSAFAQFNEVECEGKTDGKDFVFEVEEPFPSNMVFKSAKLIVNEANNEESVFDYNVTSRRTRGFNYITYTGGGVRLEVDLWPDSSPRWASTYRSVINSSDLANKNITVSCRFPNIF